MAVVKARGIADWQRASTSAFVPLRCTTDVTGFRGTLRSRRFSSRLQVSRVQTDAIRVERTAELAKTYAGDDVLITVQRRSQGTVSQEGRTAVLTRGAAVIYDPRYPYVLDMPAGGQDLFVLRVERGILGLREPALRDVTARPLAHHLPGMASVRGFLGGLDLDRADEPVIFGTVLEQLLTAVVGLATAGRAPWDDHALLGAMRAHIAEHYGDPGLDVVALARLHAVSERKVHAVFAAAGQTPADVIRRTRLGHAHALLTATALPVSRIGERCGYPDPTTFSRAFARQYGGPPSSVRGG